MASQTRILAAVGVILFLTCDDRHAGRVGDARQMDWTAVAIAETGEIGQARGRDLTVARNGGDSVSRYGLAMSVAQVPAALMAPVVERRLGPSTSQPLFLIAPFLFVLGAAAAAGRASRLLGGSRRAQTLTILLSTLASPLAAYASIDLSESLQALALVLAYLFAVASTQKDARFRTAAAAGAAAGLAVFTKSALVAVAPLALIPLLRTDGKMLRRFVAALLGALPVLAIWLYFEVARFGSPFTSYGGESFSHSFVDGLWRLLVGPNKGLFLYFPALAAVVLAGVRVWRERDWVRRQAFAGAAAPCLALLCMAAPWWAWHGALGWGPRLLVPSIPLLAVWAAAEMDRWPTAARVSLLVAGILINLPPLLQHPVPVMNYELASAWPRVDAEDALTLPRFAIRRQESTTLATPDHVLNTVPSASDLIVLPWFWWARSEDLVQAADRLSHPPWLAARPDIRPPDGLSASNAGQFTGVSGWRHWGSSFSADSLDAQRGDVYVEGLTNQVLRAQQLRRVDQAVALARKLVDLSPPSGLPDALLLEGFRLSHRADLAAEWLQSLSRDRRSHPAINLVLALFERDRGNDASAHQLLSSVAQYFGGTPAAAAAAAPLAAWPVDFASMTADLSLEVERR